MEGNTGDNEGLLGIAGRRRVAIRSRKAPEEGSRQVVLGDRLF